MPATSRERKRFQRKQRRKHLASPASSAANRLHYFSWSIDMPDGQTLWTQDVVTESDAQKDRLWLHRFLQAFIADHTREHGPDAAARLGVPFVFLAIDSIAAANERQLLWERLDIADWLATAERRGVCRAARPHMFATLRAFYQHLQKHDEISATDCATVVSAIDRAAKEHRATMS